MTAATAATTKPATMFLRASLRSIDGSLKHGVVEGHGHEQQREVKKRVVEEKRGRASIGAPVKPDAEGDEARPQHESANRIEGAEEAAGQRQRRDREQEPTVEEDLTPCLRLAVDDREHR